MTIPESTHPLFQAIGLKPFNLPDDTKAWNINHQQAELLKAKMSKEPEVKKVLPPGGTMYSWGSQDPVMILTPNDSGIVFASLEKAERILPKLRQHGLLKEELFWYLVIEGEEVERLLALPGNEKQISDLGPPFFALETPKGVLKRMGDGSGMWFGREEDARQYQEGVWELNKMR
ncbi:MAG: hypothetical protein AAF587_35130 [Bacteroidota bacterium]